MIKKTIVWIDDEAEVIFPVVQPLLEDYNIVTIGSKREALERLDQLRDCDLVLLDVILPIGEPGAKPERYTGVSLLEIIREKQIDTPVLVLTVVKNRGVIRRLRELSIVNFATKPIRPSELKSLVEAVLR